MKGAVGAAADTSDAGIACRQIGPIEILVEIKDGERVFDERRSLVFKTLQVVRFFDRERNVLVCVSYSVVLKKPQGGNERITHATRDGASDARKSCA